MSWNFLFSFFFLIVGLHRWNKRAVFIRRKEKFKNPSCIKCNEIFIATKISFSFVSSVCSSIKEWPVSTYCHSPVTWMLKLINWWVPFSSRKNVLLNPNQAVKVICYRMSCYAWSVHLGKLCLFIPPVQQPSLDLDPLTGYISHLNSVLMYTARLKLFF